MREMETLLLRLEEAKRRYGNKLLLVLRAALEVTDEYRSKGVEPLGDFDYKGLVRKLKEMGIDYKPSAILRALEKEYNIIETSYRSGNQHWWRFVDEEAIRELFEEEEEEENPKIEMFKIQLAAIGAEEVKEKLMGIIAKGKASGAEREWFKRFAFETLPLIVEMIEKAEEEGIELKEAKEILKLARAAARYINKRKATVSL